jgi:threonine aldolase
MRYLSAQFIPYLDGLWLENASLANQRAAELGSLLAKYPQIELTQKIESNQIFCTIPTAALEILRRHYFFYMWNEARGEARFVTSWDTTPEDIAAFGRLLEDIFA